MRGLVARLKSMGLTIQSRWWVLLAGILLVPTIWTADQAYFWVAWNWWNVPFQAACRDHEYIYDGDLDDLHFVDGELSREFWDDMRDLLPKIFDGLRYYWSEDGILMVPRGFNLPVPDAYWSRWSQEPEERAHEITTFIVYRIYTRRLEEGVDMAPYARYVEKAVHYWPNIDGPAPDVCGMMEKLVFKGGELSR